MRPGPNAPQDQVKEGCYHSRDVQIDQPREDEYGVWGENGHMAWKCGLVPLVWPFLAIIYFAHRDAIGLLC